MFFLPVFVEYPQLVEHLTHARSGGDQVGDSEVIGSGFLLETTSRHSHDSSGVDQVHTVFEVGLFTLSQRLVNELFRKMESGEAVHGTLNLSAGDVGH